jgi:trigger factor
MNTRVEKNLEQSEVTLRIAATGDELRPYLKAAAHELSRATPLKGFRPGKASVEVAARVFGTERLLNEAADRAVPQFFVRAVLDEEIEAIARPAITIRKLSAKEGIEFTARVAVLPQVVLGDAHSITATRRSVTVSDEDVERELTYLAKMRSKTLDVARPAQRGDTVTVDFTITMNGAPMQGGESKNHPIQLGEGHFVADFEDKLVGIRAGEKRQFTIEFPADYARHELRGKKAEAQVQAHTVQQRLVPDLNDDFAKQLGSFKNLAELKTALRKNLEHERHHRERERFRGELSNKLAEAAKFSHIPDALITKEIDRRMNELEQMLALQHKTLDDYFVSQQTTQAQARQEMRAVAEQAIKVGLALRKFSEQENITVEMSEVEARIAEYAKQFSSPREAEQHIDPAELKENMTHLLRNQKALDRLEKLIGPRGDI